MRDERRLRREVPAVAAGARPTRPSPSVLAGSGDDDSVDNVPDCVYIVHVASGWRHPHKEINKALAAAADAGFDVMEVKSGHVWGHVRAPNGQELTVWSTPRSPETMAKRIREFVRRNRN